MNQAEEFIKNNNFDNAALMTALDNSNIDSEQDYENETTIWVFDDKSFIKINNEDIEIGIN